MLLSSRIWPLVDIAKSYYPEKKLYLVTSRQQSFFSWDTKINESVLMRKQPVLSQDAALKCSRLFISCWQLCRIVSGLTPSSVWHNKTLSDWLGRFTVKVNENVSANPDIRNHEGLKQYSDLKGTIHAKSYLKVKLSNFNIRRPSYCSSLLWEILQHVYSTMESSSLSPVAR